MVLIILLFYGYNMYIVQIEERCSLLAYRGVHTKRVKELCSKHKVSKYRLAQLTDMSQTALANIMNKKSIPTVPTLERICDAFGISIAQFFAGDGMRPDLTDEQEELLEIWDDLSADERRILMNFVRTLKK